MGVDRRREGADMPRKPLRQEQIPARSVHVGHGRVPQRVEAVGSVKPRPSLPPGPRMLDASLRDPPA